MTRKQLRPVFIFALNTELEREHYILHKNGLESNHYKQVLGSYKGVQEKSYVVDEDFENVVFKLAKEHNQESVLFLDEVRDAYLVFIKDGRQVKIGKWQAVQDVKGLDAYTIDQTTGQAYAVKEA